MKKFWFYSGIIALCNLYNPAAAKVTFNIEYLDATGYGFNSATAVTPAGGNSGTTLGAQRRLAFEAALKKYENVLTSTIPIHVQAYYENMGGSYYSATLASAGPELFSYGFRNAPRSGIAFPTALANKLSGLDLSNASKGFSDIEVSINADVDGTTVLGNSTFYYGLDSRGGSSNIDFITVITHELMHGLGFVSLIDPEDGSAHACSTCTDLKGDVYSLNLAKMNSGVENDLLNMTQSDRLAAATAEGQVVWTGNYTLSQALNLTGGKLYGRPLIYTPAPAELGSSLSHNDFDVSPEALMQPGYTGPLGLSAINLTMLADIGWGAPGDLEASMTESDTGTNTIAMTLVNNGGTNVSNATLILTTTVGSIISLDNSNCTAGTLKLTCTISSISAGQTTNYDFQIANATGSATITANIGGNIVDLAPSNNEDSITISLSSDVTSTTSDRSLDGSSDAGSSGTSTVIKESGGSSSIFMPLLLISLLIGRLKNFRQ